MTTQPDLFSPDSVWEPPTPVTPIFDRQHARRLRDEAIARVDAHAAELWKRSAYEAICRVAEAQDEFTTDDVWEVLYDMGVDSPHEPRALGAVMRRAAKDGVISATNKIEQSARTVCHAAPKRVWISLLVSA